MCVWWLGAGGGGSVPAQMGGEASSELDATSPGAPVNLCPESVTSSRCGSLPGAKNSSFSFESFLVPGCLGPLGLPISCLPTEEKKKKKNTERAAGEGARKAGPLVHLLYTLAQRRSAPCRPTGAWRRGGGQV